MRNTALRILSVMHLCVCMIMLLPTIQGSEYIVEGSLRTEKTDSMIKVSFALKQKCDVQVCIKKDGKIVRHLAAGLVGPYSTDVFKKGLKQTVIWDGLDDFKKPVSVAGCSVELGAKLQANLHQIIGWDGNFLVNARGFCFAPENDMIIVSGEKLLGHRNSTIIARYKESGEYQNQIYPPAGGLKESERQGMPTVTLPTGETVPVIYHMLSRALLPSATFDGRTNAVISLDGKSLYFLSGTGREMGISHPDVQGGRRILKLNIDGTVPEDYLGPVIAPENRDGFASAREGSVALSPDGKSIYVTGIQYMNKKGKWARVSNDN